MEQQKSNQGKGYLRTALVLQLIIVAIGLSSFAGILSLNEPDQLPVYKGGNDKMYRLISDNIQYPHTAREGNSSGTAYVSFRVNKQGKVEDVVAKKRGNNLLDGVVVVGYPEVGVTPSTAPTGVNEILEKEAIRVVRNLGAFTPAMNNGKPVEAILTIPITFKLKN